MRLKGASSDEGSRAPFACGVWYAREVMKQVKVEGDEDPENASVRL